MYLLDTNVIAEIRKARSGRANTGLSRWVADIPSPMMFVSVISLHELELGVLLAERRDPERGELLRRWLDESVLPAFVDRMLPIDQPIAVRSAGLHVSNPAPFRDALIAATALVCGLTVVTRNATDFERFDGLEVINPWT